MFIECHDLESKFVSYINSDKISQIHIEFINDDKNKILGYGLEAYVTIVPDGKKLVSQIYNSKEEAEKALKDMVKKVNKHH